MTDSIAPQVEGQQPRKRGRPKGSTNRPRIDLARVRETVAQGLGMANALVLRSLSPLDALDEREIALLTDGVLSEIEANPKLQRIVAKTGAVGAHGKLLLACALIAYPRLVRRGILPGNTISATSVPVEAGRTSSDIGRYGDGQVNAFGAPIGGADVHGFATDESGFNGAGFSRQSDSVGVGA